MKQKIFLLSLSFLILSNIGTAQELTMFKGFMGDQFYQDDNKISKGEIETILLEDYEAHKLWKKSKTHTVISYVAFAAEIGFFSWYIAETSQLDQPITPLVGVLVSAGVALGFQVSSNNLKRDAILRFNKIKGKSTTLIGPTYNGLGLVHVF